MKYPPVYYGEYLKLDSVLNAQELKSKEYGKEAHDETLFIIIHQVYELWFKQIIHEIDSVYKLIDTDRIKPTSLNTICHRMNRVVEIQRLLNEQLNVIETMTSLDFMDFRDFLVPASGFQSIQFREIELKLGLRQKYRLGIDQQFFNSRLKAEHREYLTQMEEKPTFLELIGKWLERMPFAQQEHYNFWNEYQKSVEGMLTNDRQIIESNETLTEQQKAFELKNLEATKETFAVLFSEERYQELEKNNQVRISRKAKMAAVFIRLFRDEPIFQQANRILDLMLDIDELFTTWRYRHSIMAHRMLGSKIGTGGSSGHEYLKNSADNNRVFTDFFNLATFLLPRTHLPKLPDEVIRELGFSYR